MDPFCCYSTLAVKSFLELVVCVAARWRIGRMVVRHWREESKAIRISSFTSDQSLWRRWQGLLLKGDCRKGGGKDPSVFVFDVMRRCSNGLIRAWLGGFRLPFNTLSIHVRYSEVHHLKIKLMYEYGIREMTSASTKLSYSTSSFVLCNAFRLAFFLPFFPSFFLPSNPTQ
jgi:hypothetical protein